MSNDDLFLELESLRRAALSDGWVDAKLSDLTSLMLVKQAATIERQLSAIEARLDGIDDRIIQMMQRDR